MHRMLFTTLFRARKSPAWRAALSAFLLLIATPAYSADAPASAGTGEASAPAQNPDVIVSTKPMSLEAEGGTVSGQLELAPDRSEADAGNLLRFTLTDMPEHGRVGLAGGDDTDFYNNRTSHQGYFIYQAENDYEGTDSFSYTVRDENTGVVFRNSVIVTVKPTPPIVLEKFSVTATREKNPNVHEVLLTTRPNTAVAQKIPSHEDYMTPEARAGIANPKVAYLLDEKAKPQHGTARLDRATGQLTYSPNPDFIGEDRMGYYTYDENNQQFTIDNTVLVKVEPIRTAKHLVVDRSRSREVDLVFVINNSPSMAAHQKRLAANLARFRQLFREYDLDYRIGVLTTDFVNADPHLDAADQNFFKEVDSVALDKAGKPVLNRRNEPKHITKRVASNGTLVTLPTMDQPWITPQTPDSIFAELVKVGTNGNSNRTAFTSVYNFVAGYYNKQHAFLRPGAKTIVVFFMDEEETRMAVWKDKKDKSSQGNAEWIEDGKLPDLLKQYNARNPRKHQTLDGYIEQWVLRPFIIVKGNRRGLLEIDAVVGQNNLSHRRAAELTGGTVLNIESDFSAPLAALGDRIAQTVSVALEPVPLGSTLYKKSLRVLVDGQEVAADPQNGYVYDDRTNSVSFQGSARKQAFTAKIEVNYEEHK